MRNHRSKINHYSRSPARNASAVPGTIIAIKRKRALMIKLPLSNSSRVAPPHIRKVLLVDDHPVVREGLTRRINSEADLNVCAEAKSAAEALQAIQQSAPDVVVVDLALPGTHGLELIKEIRSQEYRLPVLVFTMFDEAS